jgi:hypothetical protein
VNPEVPMLHLPLGRCTHPSDRNRGSRTVCIALAIVIGVGCRHASPPHGPTYAAGEGVTAPDTSIDNAMAMSGAESEWVRTPGAGLLHRSCVHQVPDGAVVRFDTVQLVDGRRYVIPACRVIRAPVVNIRRESETKPSARQEGRLVVDVAIGPRDRTAVVIVEHDAKVYTRRGMERLIAATVDSLAVGDELELWFDRGIDREAARLSPRSPVYYPQHVIVRRQPR